MLWHTYFLKTWKVTLNVQSFIFNPPSISIHFYLLSSFVHWTKELWVLDFFLSMLRVHKPTQIFTTEMSNNVTVHKETVKLFTYRLLRYVIPANFAREIQFVEGNNILLSLLFCNIKKSSHKGSFLTSLYYFSNRCKYFLSLITANKHTFILPLIYRI